MPQYGFVFAGRFRFPREARKKMPKKTIEVFHRKGLSLALPVLIHRNEVLIRSSVVRHD